MSTIQSRPDFEQQLQENLILYTTAFENEIPHHNLFNVQREVAIARYALSKQAEAYAKGIQVLNEVLDIALSKGATDANVFSNIMAAINAIEVKSNSLIQSVQKVTTLLGQVANIDIDRASLSHLILRLPSLTREAIEISSGDSQLAERVSSELNHRVSQMMVALRFSDDLKPNKSSEDSSSGITLDEYSRLFNTVPSQPEQQLSPPTVDGKVV